MKKLLLLSSSRCGDSGYLEQPLPYMRKFLPAGISRALFIPYAGVTITPVEYHQMVASALSPLNLHIANLAEASDPVQAVNDAELILVGGGNTFQLLASLYRQGLMEPIRARVNAGIPYIGWSAGSNIAGPTICTTNDMPIVFPPSFAALNLVPYQLNPHFTDETIAGHNGESRSQRLAEYLTVNQEQQVVALPEGCCIEIEGDRQRFYGIAPGKILRHQCPAKPLEDGDLLS